MKFFILTIFLIVTNTLSTNLNKNNHLEKTFKDHVYHILPLNKAGGQTCESRSESSINFIIISQLSNTNQIGLLDLNLIVQYVYSYYCDNMGLSRKCFFSIDWKNHHPLINVIFKKFGSSFVRAYVDKRDVEKNGDREVFDIFLNMKLLDDLLNTPAIKKIGLFTFLDLNVMINDHNDDFFNLVAIVLHEVGHVIGLAEINPEYVESNSIMNYFSPSNLLIKKYHNCVFWLDFFAIRLCSNKKLSNKFLNYTNQHLLDEKTLICFQNKINRFLLK